MGTIFLIFLIIGICISVSIICSIIMGSVKTEYDRILDDEEQERYLKEHEKKKYQIG